MDSGDSQIESTAHAAGGRRASRISQRYEGISGRARLEVVGLRGNDRLKAQLEGIDPEKGIRSISASEITGNILVFYDPDRELPEIVGYLEIVIQQPPPPRPKPRKEPEPERPGGFFGFLRDLFGFGFGTSRSDGPPALTPAVTRRHTAPLLGRAPETLPKGWHEHSARETAVFWRTTAEAGLTTAEAETRLNRYGANVLSPLDPRSALSMLAEQFTSLPVLLLIGSAALSLATGGIADAIIIGAVIVLNAGIGFATEFHAERTIQSLLELSEPEATVIRDGAVQIVSGDDVVPGDMLVLRRGEPVVADARLAACTRLTVDEAALTGESMPLEKRPETLAVRQVALADRRNMVYRGTVVTGGQGLAIVVATGRHTEIGKIQSLLAGSVQPETPLQRQMRGLGTQLTWLVSGITAAMFGIGLLRGFSVLEMVRSAVSLAIATVPEGLPTVATVCLANGMRSLLQDNVLARRLAAIEALGGVRVLCFDKTGTLTWNRMSAVAVFVGMRQHTVTGITFLEGDRPIAAAAHAELSKLLEVCALCSEATVELQAGEWMVEGSPTETAMVRMALNGGVDVAGLRHRFPLLRFEHRTEKQAHMTTLHRLPDGRALMALKGSPAEVLQLCDWHAKDGRVHKLGEGERAEILAANAKMASGGLRVLGTACLEVESASRGPHRFVWLGLVGLADPPRLGMKEVIADLHRAGVRPLMLTGDQAATAEALAETLGLNGGERAIAVHATDFDSLDEGEAAALSRTATVFSRVTPSHKLQIVRALQSDGATVAMTGDGVNDAPALKAADVGIALGQSGTRVARGVADLLLMDDNIASLLPAIREGRTVGENLRKAVHYIAATNASEMLVMFTAITAGLGQPFNPRQLLWINLITDVFPELALAVEPADPDIMSRPPRDSSQPIIGRPDYARLGKQSVIMSASAMSAYVYGLVRYGGGVHASTMAFLSLTSAQLLHGLSARSENRGAALAPNPAMRNGLLAGFGLLLASQFIPGLTSLLGATRIGATDALVCAGAAVASFLANEAVKEPSTVAKELERK